MGFTPRDGEIYTIRRKVFKIMGAGFQVYGSDGQLAGYCKQKAFKLKEDIRVYTDESQSAELFRISARSVLDFGATYDVTMPTGESMGSLRRKAMASLMQDSWLVFDANENEIASLKEDSKFKAIARRLLNDYSSLMPQSFTLATADGEAIATYRTHFNLFVYRLGITIHTEHEELDDLMILAAGCLLAAIEGRQ